MSRAPGRPRGFWPLRDLPVVLWLLAVVFVAALNPFFAHPEWLMIHLLLLGAATNAIVVWSRHFADALLHTAPRPSERREQSQRLLLLNAGVLAVVVGVPAGWWELTLAGATAVVVAVLWHAAVLVRHMRRALPSRFGAMVRYYVVAACFLPLGATLGTLLAMGMPDELEPRLVLAHASVNILGWMGLSVLGTLVTLWPTMLRTRIADGAERSARRALPLLALAVAVTATGSVAGSRPVAALGLAGYLAGVATLSRSFVTSARSKRPTTYSALSALASVVWLVGSVTALAIGTATARSWAVADERFDTVVPFLAAGFGAQVLLGALSYLVPVALGGGPSAVRAADAVLNTLAAPRIAVINAGLLALLMPVHGLARHAILALVLAGFAAFLPVLFAAMRASRTARRTAASDPPSAHRTAPRPAVGPPIPTVDSVQTLQRWVTSGGLWSVAHRSADRLEVSLLTCDGGQEMDRLVSGDPALREFVGTRTRSDDDVAT